MGENLRESRWPENKIELAIKESNWLNNFNIVDIDEAKARRLLEVWEIRKDHSQMEIWMKERKLFILFFDGALKGYPGMARGGGIIILPEGNNQYEYY